MKRRWMEIKRSFALWSKQTRARIKMAWYVLTASRRDGGNLGYRWKEFIRGIGNRTVVYVAWIDENGDERTIMSSANPTPDLIATAAIGAEAELRSLVGRAEARRIMHGGLNRLRSHQGGTLRREW